MTRGSLRRLHRFAADDSAKLPFAMAAMVLLMVSGASSTAMVRIQEHEQERVISQGVQEAADLLASELGQQARLVTELALVAIPLEEIGKTVDSDTGLPSLADVPAPPPSEVTTYASAYYRSYFAAAFPRVVGGVSFDVRDASFTVVHGEPTVRDVVRAAEGSGGSGGNGGYSSASDFSVAGEIVDVNATTFYNVVGSAVISVKGHGRTIEREVPIDEWVYDQGPFVGMKMEAFERSATGADSEVGRLVTYMLQTVAQWRLLTGAGGGVETIPAPGDVGSILTDADVRKAVEVALALTAAHHFRDARVPDADRTKAPVLDKVLQEYGTSGTIDPADVLLVMQEGRQGEVRLDARVLLAQAMYVVADQLAIKYLEFWGLTTIADILANIVGMIEYVLENVLEALEEAVDWIADQFGAGDSAGEEAKMRVAAHRAEVLSKLQAGTGTQAYFIMWGAEERTVTFDKQTLVEYWPRQTNAEGWESESRSCDGVGWVDVVWRQSWTWEGMDYSYTPNYLGLHYFPREGDGAFKKWLDDLGTGDVAEKNAKAQYWYDLHPNGGAFEATYEIREGVVQNAIKKGLVDIAMDPRFYPDGSRITIEPDATDDSTALGEAADAIGEKVNSLREHYQEAPGQKILLDLLGDVLSTIASSNEQEQKAYQSWFNRHWPQWRDHHLIQQRWRDVSYQIQEDQTAKLEAGWVRVDREDYPTVECGGPPDAEDESLGPSEPRFTPKLTHADWASDGALESGASPITDRLRQPLQEDLDKERDEERAKFLRAVTSYRSTEERGMGLVDLVVDGVAAASNGATSALDKSFLMLALDVYDESAKLIADAQVVENTIYRERLMDEPFTFRLDVEAEDGAPEPEPVERPLEFTVTRTALDFQQAGTTSRSGMHWTDLGRFTHVPYEWTWSVSVKGSADYDVESTSDALRRAGFPVERGGDLTVPIDLDLSILLSGAWPLANVPYDVTDDIVGTITDAIQWALNQLLDLLMKILEPIMDVVGFITEMFQAGLSTTAEVLEAVLSPIVEFFIDVLGDAVNEMLAICDALKPVLDGDGLGVIGIPIRFDFADDCLDEDCFSGLDIDDLADGQCAGLKGALEAQQDVADVVGFAGSEVVEQPTQSSWIPLDGTATGEAAAIEAPAASPPAAMADGFAVAEGRTVETGGYSSHPESGVLGGWRVGGVTAGGMPAVGYRLMSLYLGDGDGINTPGFAIHVIPYVPVFPISVWLNGVLGYDALLSQVPLTIVIEGHAASGDGDTKFWARLDPAGTQPSAGPDLQGATTTSTVFSMRVDHPGFKGQTVTQELIVPESPTPFLQVRYHVPFSNFPEKPAPEISIGLRIPSTLHADTLSPVLDVIAVFASAGRAADEVDDPLQGFIRFLEVLALKLLNALEGIVGTFFFQVKVPTRPGEFLIFEARLDNPGKLIDAFLEYVGADPEAALQGAGQTPAKDLHEAKILNQFLQSFWAEGGYGTGVVLRGQPHSLQGLAATNLGMFFTSDPHMGGKLYAGTKLVGPPSEITSFVGLLKALDLWDKTSKAYKKIAKQVDDATPGAPNPGYQYPRFRAEVVAPLWIARYHVTVHAAPLEPRAVPPIARHFAPALHYLADDEALRPTPVPHLFNAASVRTWTDAVSLSGSDGLENALEHNSPEYKIFIPPDAGLDAVDPGEYEVYTRVEDRKIPAAGGNTEDAKVIQYFILHAQPFQPGEDTRSHGEQLKAQYRDAWRDRIGISAPADGNALIRWEVVEIVATRSSDACAFDGWLPRSVAVTGRFGEAWSMRRDWSDAHRDDCTVAIALDGERSEVLARSSADVSSAAADWFGAAAQGLREADGVPEGAPEYELTALPGGLSDVRAGEEWLLFTGWWGASTGERTTRGPAFMEGRAVWDQPGHVVQNAPGT